MLSAFTPTHNPHWLPDVYRSLCWQDYTDWQWVIVPNGKKAQAGSLVIPEAIRRDPRVKIVPGAEKLDFVGALKKFACDHCDGEAFIELDHDDLLVPGKTLSRIHAAIREGAGFVHSDCAVFHEGSLGQFTYDRSFGWEAYPVTVFGRRLLATRSFPVNPQVLCEVYYAPDHVRVWSRSAYDATGGHNPKLSVADDHDMVCRTYLSGAKFVDLDECCYLYRMHPSNTVEARFELIRKNQDDNRRRYLSRLIRHWCAEENLTYVDVGQMMRDGWQWERDLHFGFGAPESVGAILVPDCIQFCPGRLFCEFMNRAFDALVPGGYLEVKFFDARTSLPWIDPHAACHYVLENFLVYCERALADRSPDRRCRFQYIQHHAEFRNDFYRQNNMPWLTIHMAALKGQRQPGEKKI